MSPGVGVIAIPVLEVLANIVVIESVKASGARLNGLHTNLGLRTLDWSARGCVVRGCGCCCGWLLCLVGCHWFRAGLVGIRGAWLHIHICISYRRRVHLEQPLEDVLATTM